MKKFLGILLVSMALLFNSCELDTTGTVKVINLTGSSIVVDVNDGNGSWQGERTVYSGSSTSYTDCEEGSVDGAARFSDGYTWYYSSTRTLVAGGTIEITWYPTKKSTEIETGGLGEMVDGIIIESSTKGDKN